MTKTNLNSLNNKFPYGIYSKGKMELEEGTVIGDIASEGKVKIEKDFKLEGKESSIYVAEENVRSSDFGNYGDRQKTLIDSEKREYDLIEFPDMIDFPKENINELNIDNIEIKSNVNIRSKEPEIDIGDNEYELELIIDESVAGNIYIDINNSNMDKYEELEIKFKDNIKISGNVYVDMNVNSNSKETEMEMELGKNTSIVGNIYVNINSNNGDSKEIELEIELERGARIEGDIYVNIKGQNEYEKTKFEMELDEDSMLTGNIYTNAKKLEIEGTDSNKDYGVINGLIYAPRSKIELEDGIKINGAVVGNTIEVEDKKTIITYDPKYI